MKSFRKVVIATMLTVAPVLAVGTAWANTELSPASRLVAPYWDITSGRGTLMLITNVSKKANLQTGAVAADLGGVCNLTAAPGPGGTTCGVHLEFYDKTCQNVDTPIDLSKRDIDQLDLNNDTDMGLVRSLPSGYGWLDLDVRKGAADHGATGVQANVLLGTVIISDTGSGFAVAYPMASSIGSSNTGIGGDIVTRNSGGTAMVWSGGYESFPARVFVPMFFGEGVNGITGQNFTSTLAIAGPAQSIAGGEAPGQDLEDINGTVADESVLIDASVQVVDACEFEQSDALEDHYVKGKLQGPLPNGLFSASVTATAYKTNTPCNGYPSADTDRPGVTSAANAFKGGWIDILNDNAFGQNFTAGALKSLTSPNNIERGLVGVLVQNTVSTTGTSLGDTTRLWGDCAFGNGSFGEYNPATALPGNVANFTPSCRINPTNGNISEYSLVNVVNHNDTRP